MLSSLAATFRSLRAIAARASVLCAQQLPPPGVLPRSRAHRAYALRWRADAHQRRAAARSLAPGHGPRIEALRCRKIFSLTVKDTAGCARCILHCQTIAFYER